MGWTRSKRNFYFLKGNIFIRGLKGQYKISKKWNFVHNNIPEKFFKDLITVC